MFDLPKPRHISTPPRTAVLTAAAVRQVNLDKQTSLVTGVLWIIGHLSVNDYS